ncbi:hypothetical protein [Inquilinus sp. CA228]|uniref:hypothetical protein n=1 Tax=Inquilinus sp. CA228 TaxID=3455609 RepID=UPI003F8D021B
MRRTDHRAVRCRRAGALLLLLPLCGCAGIGPTTLYRDHLDYAKAITDAQKEQTLMNVVRLRYADVPAFLSINQVVASRSLQRTGTVGATGYPDFSAGTFGALTGSVQYNDNPTITFSPVSGPQFAGSFVRPLAPSELFPLAQNGLPIDVLLRLGVQSIGRLENAGRPEITTAAQGAQTTGSPAFFRLLAGLRTLQDSGGLSFRFTGGKDGAHVYLLISNGSDPALAAEMRSLLGMGTDEAEIVYGRTASRPNQVAMLTRSFIGVLAHVSGQIDVPDADVEAHRTLASIGHAGGEQRPSIVVRTGQTKPADAFAAIPYRDRWFWIADTDFESKVAFSIVQLLMAIAQGEVDKAAAPVLTISAGGN